MVVKALSTTPSSIAATIWSKFVKAASPFLKAHSKQNLNRSTCDRGHFNS